MAEGDRGKLVAEERDQGKLMAADRERVKLVVAESGVQEGLGEVGGDRERLEVR